MNPTNAAAAPFADARHVNREHQVQLRLLQELASRIEAGSDHGEALEVLTDYTRAHFLSEELLMRQYEFPEYDAHTLDHERMLDWLEELADAKRDATSRRHAVKELTALFLRHIASRDRQLHDFLEAL